MPEIAISAEDFIRPDGAAKLRAEVFATMLHPREKPKRDALLNAVTMLRARTMAAKLGIGLQEDATVLSLLIDLPPLEVLLDEPLGALVKSMRGGKQRRPLLAGEVAGIVLQDFLAEDSANPGSARLGRIIGELSSDLLRGGAMKNCSPKKIQTAWEDFKTVSHFWLAFNQFRAREADIQLFMPRNPEQAAEFYLIALVAWLRASRTATSRTGTLLDNKSWTFPVWLDADWLLGSRISDLSRPETVK